MNMSFDWRSIENVGQHAYQRFLSKKHRDIISHVMGLRFYANYIFCSIKQLILIYILLDSYYLIQNE